MTAADKHGDTHRVSFVEHKLSQLAGGDLPPGDFFKRFLHVVAEELSATAAAAWGLNQQGVLAKISEVNQARVDRKGSADAARSRIKRMIELVCQPKPEAQVMRSGAATDDDDPANYVLLLVPLRSSDRCIGVIELFLLGSTSDESAAERLRVLIALTAHASRYIARQMVSSQTGDGYQRRLDAATLLLHQDLDLERVALTAATEGRLILECDRLAVALRQNGKTKIVAISGQDRVLQQSNLVRAMTTVADRALESGQHVFFGRDRDALPPQIEQVLEEYALESGARTIEAIPVRCRPAECEAERGKSRDEPLGMLLVEHMSEVAPQSSDLKTEFSQRVAGALSNALTYRRATGLVPGWVVDRYHAARESSHAQVAIWGSVIGSLLVACLAVVPVPYRVEAVGTLTPVSRSQLFAPYDGVVRKVAVTGGQRVAAGQLLVQIENEQLATELLTTRNGLREQKQHLSMLEAQSSDLAHTNERAGAIQLQGSISQTQIEIASLTARVAALERELKKLAVKSVRDGNVATFQPADRLLDRPVNRGELLLEVMDPQGPWQLDLDVPVRRAGHLLAAQRSVDRGELPVEFVLETMPERTFSGTVKEVASTASIRADRSVVVPVRVAVEGVKIPDRLAGAEVRARISCGRKKLFYVLFGDVIDFFRRHVW